MSGGYRAVSGLAVLHPYFAAGWPPALRLQADAGTAALMTRLDLRLRGDARRFVIMADGTGLDGLWRLRDEWPAQGLSFAAHSPDPLWAYYTDVRRLAGTGTLRLAFALADAAHDSQAAWLAAAPVNHVVTLPVRKTIWKYVMVGEWGADLGVADVDGAVTFNAPESEQLPDGTMVTVIRSAVPLALAERPRQRFVLQRGTAGDMRVLVPRLPLASPAALRREMVGGLLCDVSEIFVNR
ncbi:hypothetical protein [Cupriavidus campinensis]|uniref:Uncharacterized protein n=1 Tax=Cupriavidus campinensis TaxID=151783 RepID=A0AAE9I3K3_9BURK|nr:hypothetical protein [Cupriavidus campinensis]URF05720.1 hypothetical protein M5D45_07965 [Cupriavidus campinensis]